ncbi:MAG TPA: NUDIX hydrolase [Acidobacteriota bacterium]|jgi:8-oxo-dGTP pyrophosphatase MutT (NUDIX family)
MNKTRSPWKILGERGIYDNEWINVTEYDVVNPSGGTGIYGKVHFKNFAIGIIALDDEMNTYLVGQYRFPLNAYSWEIPEGGGPLEVDMLESAKRELKEETGLIAAQWTRILNLHLSNSVSDEYGAIFLARQLTQQQATPEETEQLAVKKLPFEEVYEMVEEGKITDSLTVAGVLKVKLMLLNGKLLITA